MNPDTVAATAGREPAGGSLVPPIWATSVWSAADPAEASRAASSTRPSRFYSRYGNPTVAAFENAVAALEGAQSALAFGSGMGAISATVLALCSTGDHIVSQRQLYAGTLFFFQSVCPRLGIEVTLVDGTQPGAFAAAVRPGRTMMVFAETPSNPRVGLVDLAELGAIRGPFTVVDSTFATPIGQRPLEHGVSLVLHSATKALAGHNDATLGVIAGEGELIDAIWAYATLHGAVASPFDAWNATRGIRTLDVRVQRSAANAATIAEALEAHPRVRRVWYPGLASHPHHELARTQMRNGGSMLAIEVGESDEEALAALGGLKLCRVATSLGGPDTLVCHPATTTHAGLDPALQADIGVTPNLLRISVGLENPADVIDDLTAAIG